MYKNEDIDVIINLYFHTRPFFIINSAICNRDSCSTVFQDTLEFHADVHR